MAEEARLGWRDPHLFQALDELPIAELDALVASLPREITQLQENGKWEEDSAPIRPVEFYSCFVSHSSADTAIAQKINDDLRTNGIKSWYAPEDLKIGDVFRLRIDESIRLHDKLLLILSHSSVNSRWVQSEVEAAFEEERRRSDKLPAAVRGNVTLLFPIRIDDTILQVETGWAAEVRRTRHIGDFRNWADPNRYAASLKKLLRDLAASDELDEQARIARRGLADRLHKTTGARSDSPGG
jgi:hypothetical protein